MSSEREQGFQALQQGDTATAISLLELATQSDPSDYQAHIYLGAAYGQSNRHEDAVRVLTQAVTLQPSNAQARYNLGISLQRAGWPNEAMTAFQQALTLQPNYPQAQHALFQVQQTLASPNITAPLPSLSTLQAPQATAPSSVDPNAQPAYASPAQPAPQQGYAPPQQGYAPPQQGYAPQPGYAPPPAQGYAPQGAAYANALAFQNTSGMNADTPYEVQMCRWNWGAFLLPKTWLMNHGMIGQGIGMFVLLFIPLGSLVHLGLAIYLGVKGHELGWKKRRFEGLPHYFDVQTKWMWWGVGVNIALMILGILIWTLVFAAIVGGGGKISVTSP